MRARIDFTDVDERILMGLDDSYIRGIENADSIRWKISHAIRNGKRVSLNQDEWETLIDIVANFDREMVDDVSGVWVDLREQVRGIPEWHEYLEETWESVY